MQGTMIVRICATCDKPLLFKPDGTQEGLYCCDEYYHEGDCVDVSLPSGQHWNDHYTEDGDCYFTEWDFELIKEELAK